MINPVAGVNVAGSSAAGRAATQRAAGQEEAGFGDSVGSILENLQGAEAKADAAALGAATGDLNSVSDYMIAATEAQLTTEVTVAVRNRALESFNEIMRMQV
ncbi:MAG: flagellar hook-basal body complex protein FliE [Acidimicrobiales bacterium]|jgi:flagellar hook-basal body complex protein FliE